MNEKLLIQPADIHREIEALTGCPVAFRSFRGYDYERDQWRTEFGFEANNRFVNAAVTDQAREMSLNQFVFRIIAPMVNTWRKETEEA